MSPKLLILIISLFILGAPAVVWATVEEGDEPELSLPDLDGEIVNLSDLKGSVVLIDFWATWCAPCHHALPFYEELSSKYADDGLVILAVSIDRNSRTIEGYLDQHSLDLLVLHDRRQRAFSAFNPTSMPTTYFVDRQGIVRSVHVGFRSDDRDQIENEVRRLIDQK